MTWPAILFWALLIAGFMSRGPLLLYLFSILGAFGTLQMLPGDALGGANILPQSVCAAFLAAKILTQRGNPVRAIETALDIRNVGLFTLFTATAIISAMVLPRLYNGQIDVVPISAAASGTALLAPNGAHVTQSGYASLSYLIALAFAVPGRNPEFQRHYLRALLLGAGALILTGLIDLVTFYAGATEILSPFRNASYGLLYEAEALGSKRIVGLLPEASAYGIACIVAASRLTFLRPCFEPRLRRTLVPAAIFGLLALAAFSTSSGAYVGLVVYGGSYALNWLFRWRSPSALHRGALKSEAILIVVACVGVACLLLMSPAWLTPMYDVIDVMVFQKTNSISYVERSMWTRVGWNAFLESGGIGVGFGSVRVSNWFIAVLAGTGAFGACLLFGFILRLLLAPAREVLADQAEMLRGLRMSLLPWLAMIWFIGAVPDMGADIAAGFGVLAALTAGRGASRSERLQVGTRQNWGQETAALS